MFSRPTIYLSRCKILRSVHTRVTKLYNPTVGGAASATPQRNIHEAAVEAVAGLKIFLRDVDALRSLSGVMNEHGTKGRGRVSLVLDRDLREIEMDLPQGYQISAPMRSAIKSISGVVDVIDL